MGTAFDELLGNRVSCRICDSVDHRYRRDKVPWFPRLAGWRSIQADPTFTPRWYCPQHAVCKECGTRIPWTKRSGWTAGPSASADPTADFVFTDYPYCDNPTCKEQHAIKTQTEAESRRVEWAKETREWQEQGAREKSAKEELNRRKQAERDENLRWLRMLVQTKLGTTEGAKYVAANLKGVEIAGVDYARTALPIPSENTEALSCCGAGIYYWWSGQDENPIVHYLCEVCLTTKTARWDRLEMNAE